jgi:hypothetical protein
VNLRFREAVDACQTNEMRLGVLLVLTNYLTVGAFVVLRSPEADLLHEKDGAGSEDSSP